MVSPQKTILVTGATGYVGGRLIPRLLEAGHTVRGMSRHADHLQGRVWSDDINIVEGDVLEPDSLSSVLEGVSTAYYFIHSMEGGASFDDRDAQAAHNFGAAASAAGVERIIYLGGLGVKSEENLSEHLESRQQVGEILREYDPAVTEFRAAILVGSGSASFEMIRYLTERVPIMICPQWVFTKVQPIAIEDALDYLQAALNAPESKDRIIGIGGETVLTYGDMMLGYAKVRNLERRLIPVPVLTPRLSSYWVHLVTPVPASIARPLIDGLKNEVVVRDDAAKDIFPNIQPMPYQEAVAHAVGQLKAQSVDTTWNDDYAEIDGYSFQQEQGMMIEMRQRMLDAPPEDVFTVVSRIGGQNGWLYWNWLWKVRGMLDRLIGGPGYRPQRRDPDHLRTGDVLNFWRVEDVRTNEYLMLRAEMKLPGRGWLEFQIEPQASGQTCLTQTAYYAPKGLWGFVYWYAIFFIHKYIFDGMIDALVRQVQTLHNPAAQAEVRRDRLAIGGVIVGAVAIILGGLVTLLRDD